MAEYIDRNELELDAEWSEYHDGFTAYSQGQIQCAPTADIIERSKIDKAIEEIENYLLEDSCGGEHEKGVKFALEILKRNIGE